MYFASRADVGRAGASSEEDEAPSSHPQHFLPTSPSLIRPSNLRCINTLSGHHSGVRAIAVRDGTSARVYTGSYDNTIKVWNLDCGSCEATLEGHLAWIRSLFCHAHEPLLFSGSDEGARNARVARRLVRARARLPAPATRGTVSLRILAQPTARTSRPRNPPAPA